MQFFVAVLQTPKGFMQIFVDEIFFGLIFELRGEETDGAFGQVSFIRQ